MKETIEEAAKKYPITDKGDFIERFGLNFVAHTAFIEGAKQQEKRMYSEKEVLSILNKHRKHLYTIKSQSDNEWFEQFKKK